MSVSFAALLLSAWLGASTLFAAVVAPAAFAALPSRALAGAVVGRVLPVIFVTGIVVALAAVSLDRASGGRAPRVRRVALLVMALACGAAQFVVAPRIERARADLGGAVDALAPSDPRRVAFGRLHAISVAGMGLAMVAAGAAIALTALPAAGSRPGGVVPSAARPLAPPRGSR